MKKLLAILCFAATIAIAAPADCNDYDNWQAGIEQNGAPTPDEGDGNTRRPFQLGDIWIWWLNKTHTF